MRLRNGERRDTVSALHTPSTPRPVALPPTTPAEEEISMRTTRPNDRPIRFDDLHRVTILGHTLILVRR